MPDPVSAVMGGVSLFSSISQASAAKSAAKAQSAAAGTSAAEQTDVYTQAEQARLEYTELGGAAAFGGYDKALAAQQEGYAGFAANLQPYLQSGLAGLSGQSALLGQSGTTAEQSAIERIMGGAQYQEMLRAGEESILSRASATGGLRGGNVQAALGQFAPSLLNQLVDKQYQRLTGQVGVGQNATNVLGEAQMGTATNMSNILQNQGVAESSMYNRMADITYDSAKDRALAIGSKYITQGSAEAAGITGASAAQTSGLTGLADSFAQGFGSYFPSSTGGTGGGYF